jgi:uncharacterized delta-60 repeat protein
MSYTGTTPKFESVEGDNIKVDGNTISSTNVDGDIILSPDGTGKVTVPTQTQGDNSTAAASTEYVDSAIAAIPPVDLSAYATNDDVAFRDDQILIEARDYVDEELLDYETILNVDSKDADTLASANLYTDNAIAAIPSGEVATAVNVGSGAGVYKEKVGSEFKFKSLVAGSNVTITPNADTVTISAASGGGGDSTISTYSILDGQTDALLETITDKSKAYDITYSVNRSVLDTVSKAFNIPSISTIDFRFSSLINSIAVQSDGKILVGGNFSNYAGQTGKSRLIRLNADGTEDTAFTEAAVRRDGTTANFSNDVRAVAVQSDGKILVAGNFSNYAGQTGKSFLIRLNADGTEDTAFSANAVVSGTTAKFTIGLNSLAVQSDGKILVGGIFSNYAGQTGKSYLIRLNADGTEDTAFTEAAVRRDGTTANFSSSINSLTIQSDGKILVGGAFITYAGQTGKNRLIRLNADGTEDTAFTEAAVRRDGATANFSSSVNSMVVQLDEKILIGGDFSNYAGQTGKSYLIRLNADGTEDTAFSEAAVRRSGTTANFIASVLSLALQSDGKILVGGSFTNYAGQIGKSYLIRLNADGTEDTAFSTNAVVSGTTAKFSSNVNAIAVQSDGKILVGGFFINYDSAASYFVKLNSDGSNDYLRPFNNTVFDIATQSDGKILVGGSFTNYAGQTGKSYLIRLNADGTEDTAFSDNAVVSGTTAKFSSDVLSIHVQSDGKILVGGLFTSYAGQTGKSRLIRLNADGTEDTAFSTNAVVSGTTAKFSSDVLSIHVQSDGKILLGGSFTNYAGQTGKSRLIRLNADGTEDTAFSTNAVVSGTTAKFSSNVNATAVQSDGKILVGGFFTNYAGQTGKSRLIRLNADGTEDTAFSTNAVVSGTTAKFNSSILELVIQSDGKILVGGSFTNYAGQTGKSYLIRLNADGTEDTAFSEAAVRRNGTTANFSFSIFALAIQSDGKILVGGNFSNYAGQTGKSYLIRLNADGTEDTAFSTNAVVSGTTAKFNSSILELVIQSDGKILVCGAFTGYVLDDIENSNFVALDRSYTSIQIGKLQAVGKSATELIYSTPVVLGPAEEISYPLGVTVTFNANGDITYSSTTTEDSSIVVNEIKIEKKEF